MPWPGVVSSWVLSPALPVPLPGSLRLGPCRHSAVPLGRPGRQCQIRWCRAPVGPHRSDQRSHSAMLLGRASDCDAGCVGCRPSPAEACLVVIHPSSRCDPGLRAARRRPDPACRPEATRPSVPADSARAAPTIDSGHPGTAGRPPGE